MTPKKKECVCAQTKRWCINNKPGFGMGYTFILLYQIKIRAKHIHFQNFILWEKLNWHIFAVLLTLVQKKKKKQNMVLSLSKKKKISQVKNIGRKKKNRISK